MVEGTPGRSWRPPPWAPTPTATPPARGRKDLRVRSARSSSSSASYSRCVASCSASTSRDAHPDVLSFWLPRFSFLGRSLGAGHIPLWNPYEMLGYRYAADPQSGWTYLGPMALFTAFSPGVAMRAFIALNPLLGGLSLYAFLRIERLPPIAATVGGLSLAMMMAGSELAVSLPFAGTLAWTPVVLLGACRLPAHHDVDPPPGVDGPGRPRLVPDRERPPEPRPRHVHPARVRVRHRAAGHRRSRRPPGNRRRAGSSGCCSCGFLPLAALPSRSSPGWTSCANRACGGLRPPWASPCPRRSRTSRRSPTACGRDGRWRSARLREPTPAPRPAGRAARPASSRANAPWWSPSAVRSP